jgi:geranylgeranyl transferase type-1 subunit beta
MTLGFFILSALDLLNAGPDTFPQERRQEIRDWVLKCQHPHGGFCGSPNHRFPDMMYGAQRSMDPANLPATFFAVLSLSFVGGMEGILRKEALAWLKRLQREDGSFGELRTETGEIKGGKDMRYCYVAAAVRCLLRGEEEEEEEDINIDRLVAHIRSGQVCEIYLFWK